MSGRRSWFLQLFLIALAGLLVRSIYLDQHWGRKDHYNFGGPFSSRYAFCVSQFHWPETRARMHLGCSEENDVSLSPLISELSPELQTKAKALAASTAPVQAEPVYYLNHPPFYPWLIAFAKDLLGEHEWVFRLCTLIFSVFNIFLVGLIARKIFGENRQALFAAVLQAGFLCTIYFGTHVDYMNEMHATFLLLTVFAAISGHWWLAGLGGIASGLNDWPGFLILVPLALITLLKKQGRLASLTALILMPVSIFATAAFLVGPDEVIGLFHSKLLHSGHVAAPTSVLQWLFFPLRYVQTIFFTHSRLMSPVFFALSLLALLTGIKAWRDGRWAHISQSLANDRSIQAMFMLGMTMLITMLVGAPYVMLHPFWFVPTFSAWAFLLARTYGGELRGGALAFPKVTWPRLLMILLGLAGAFYPYGIFKADPAYDAMVSFVIIGSVIWSISRVKRNLSPLSASLIALVILGNVLQVVNYRTEPPTDHDFCLTALNEYLETGKKVNLGEEPSLSRFYYCRAIPLDSH